MHHNKDFRDTVGWSVVCDSGITLSYSLVCFNIRIYHENLSRGSAFGITRLAK